MCGFSYRFALSIFACVWCGVGGQAAELPRLSLARVDHWLEVRGDCVTFEPTAENPTATRSAAQWAQAYPRLGAFTGFDDSGADLDDDLSKCFVFLDGHLSRMPFQPWATKARYVGRGGG